MLKKTIMMIFLLLGLSVSMIASDAEINKKAPEFTLNDSNGNKVKLSDYKNKWIVLEWVNFDCPFVKKHYNSKNMQTLQKSYEQKGVVWLSICSSAPKKQGNFTEDMINKKIWDFRAAPTAYLIDDKGEVGKKYGAKTTPEIFIINPKGILVYAGAIDDIATPDESDLTKAKNYVKEVLDIGLAGKPVEPKTTKSYGCSVKY